MDKYYYSYDEFESDCKVLVNELKQYPIDTIVAIARGGLTFGHFLSSLLDNRNIVSINAVSYEGTKRLETIKISNLPNLLDSNNILIVDDIVDSGRTMKLVKDNIFQLYPHLNIKTISLFYKKSAIIIPDFKRKEATKWIEFFWEK